MAEMMTRSADTDSGDAPLRLLARDGADIEVLSTLLQDAIVPGADMLFDRDRKRFIFIANRFCWERPAIADVAGEKGEPVHERSLCAVRIEGVQRVLQTNTPARRDTALFNLLAVTCGAGTDYGTYVDLMFSAGATLRLLVESIEVAAEDVEATRPTTSQPKHDNS